MDGRFSNAPRGGSAHAVDPSLGMVLVTGARLAILVNPILAVSPVGCRKLEHFRHLLREHDIIYI